MGSLTKGPVFTYHQDGGEGEDFVRGHYMVLRGNRGGSVVTNKV